MKRPIVTSTCGRGDCRRSVPSDRTGIRLVIAPSDGFEAGWRSSGVGGGGICGVVECGLGRILIGRHSGSICRAL